MERTRHDGQEDSLFAVLHQLQTQGYEDFTFTGGEPLLKWRKIIRCLDYMQQINYFPDLTFVSNGRALNSTFIKRLKEYPGSVRFNISMHSLDPDSYHKIVHTTKQDKPVSHKGRDDLTYVKQNLALLQEAGIPFKLNFVLLNGLNTSAAQLEQIFAFAVTRGASRIKFLELLITQKLKALYPYYYQLEALKVQLGGQLSFVESDLRRSVYRYRDTPLLVELQSCTCSLGCNVCSLNREANITAELRYFPCFLHPAGGVNLTVTSLEDANASGTAYIAEMSRRFGDHSPLIIRDRYLTQAETAYFYAIAKLEVANFTEHYARLHKLVLQRHRQLTEYYFSDGSEAFASFEYVRKLAINTYDYQAIEITQQHHVEADGSGYIKTSFGKESPSVASITDYQDEMARHNFQMVLQIDWTLDYYGTYGQDADHLSFSIGYSSGLEYALIRSNHPILNAPVLHPLTQTVPAWLLACRLKQNGSA